MVFKKLFGASDNKPRVLEQVSDLQEGDIISLKHRSELPEPLQGMDLEVTAVATYQYESGNSTEFTLKTAENDVYYLSMDEEDGEQSLCFAKKIKRSQVLALFDEEVFSLLWDDQQFPELVTQPVDALAAWTSESYHQSIKNAQAYFYDRDCRGQTLSRHLSDDGAQELQYHECEGDDDHFGLVVEVWSDGSTDVYLQVFTQTDVIEQFHPHDNK